MCLGQQVVFPLVGRQWGGSHLQNYSGNLHQIILSRNFREELKQKICRKTCPEESPTGSCLITIPKRETCYLVITIPKRETRYLTWKGPIYRRVSGLVHPLAGAITQHPDSSSFCPVILSLLS